MITVKCDRHKDGQVFSNTQVRTVKDALGVLINCELGFGGRVTLLSKEKVVTTTRVFDDIDITEFSGSEEDMTFLSSAAAYGIAIYAARLSEEYRPALICQIMKFTDGNPQLIELSSAMLIGSGIKKGVMIALIAGENIDDIGPLSQVSEQQLSILLEWKLDGECRDDLMSPVFDMINYKAALLAN